MHTLFRLGTFLLLLFPTIGFARAPEAEPAQLRLFQIFAASGSLSLDGQPLIQGLSYPFVSDYVDVSTGAHSLTIASDDPEAPNSKSADFEAQAGHRYTVVALTTDAEYTAFEIRVVDETRLMAGLPEGDLPVIVVHNIVGGPPLDISINDERVISRLEFGDSAAFSSPVGAYHAAAASSDDPNAFVYEADYTGLVHTNTLGALIGTAPGSIFVVTSNSSPLSVREYLTVLNDQSDSPYKGFYQALVASGVLDEMGDDGAFTLFVPEDAILNAVPDAERNALMNDPDALAAWVRQHIVAERILPGELPTHDTLPTLAGTDLVLAFPQDNYWSVNGVANIVSDIRTANGIIYEIDAVLPPV